MPNPAIWVYRNSGEFPPRRAIVMESVFEELRRRTDPTIEEYVDAVIQTHERNRSKLRTLSRGLAIPEIDDGAEDADIIRAYCLSYGVDPSQLGETQPAEPQWLTG
jgi:hypothetical protein